MELSFEDIREMNLIQMEIFKCFIRVCEQLNLTYYLIHGSLLGAVKYQGFFPFDDDIDVAMPRDDYNKLLCEGQRLLPDDLFLQSCKTEINYPMPFAKIRNNNTAFIQPLIKKLNINQGIYIDIFPLDNYPENSLLKFWLKSKNIVYQTRVSSKLFYDKNQPIWKKISRKCSMVLYPSWNRAVQKRADLYFDIPESTRVIMIGGKPFENNMPKEWFGTGTTLKFCGVDVNCPYKYKDYLSFIYGDYMNYNPQEKYMNENGTVSVSAELISTTHSYRDFI